MRESAFVFICWEIGHFQIQLKGFFLWLFRVKVILGFAFFSHAEITRFGYKNLSAQIVLCADFTPLIKFK